MQLSFDAAETPDGCLTVGELIQQMKKTVESSFSSLHVEGEVSNFTRARSGHCYFTLKDEESQLSCIMWRSRARKLRVDLEDGMLVRARGNATVYPARGQLQMQVTSVRLAGEGALQRAFEQLKKKLEAEGLFDESQKQKLPPFPVTIGIITSGDGAALHDIISTLQRRFPPARVQLCSVAVQGDRAAAQIAEAITRFQQEDVQPRPDLLIMGRGGGSLEDLWAFNEEVVARAIYASEIPVISAVGHETDFSISDFVADVRAATPTMAAELAVPNGIKLAEVIREMAGRSERLVRDEIGRLAHRVEALRQSRALYGPVDKLHKHQLKLDELIRRLTGGAKRVVRRHRHRAERIADLVQALDPRTPFERGYALVQSPDGHAITRGQSLAPQEAIDIQFKDVKRTAQIVDSQSET